jgi:hypothetical protein
MSDDDFGDFEEALPKSLEVLLDSAGRPVDLLPSVEVI